MPIAPICRQLKRNASTSGGWIDGVYNGMLNHPDVELGICYPSSSYSAFFLDSSNTKCYSFGRPNNFFGVTKTTGISPKTVADAKRIINDFQPDILHIFGTEFPHALIFAEAFHNPERTVVNLQGIVNVIGKRYENGIAGFYKRLLLPSNFILGNIHKQKRRMLQNAKNEKKLLGLANHVVGRTDWDDCISHLFNSNAHYYSIGETLRENFYTDDKWNYDSCDKNSIFVSQGDYPIKGIHYLLEALSIVQKAGVDFKVRVGGYNPINTITFSQKIGISSYGFYIKKLLKKYKLREKVEFLGSRTSEQMKEEFKKCNLYVMCSVVENSPNSLCEAMLTKTPCVSAFVGGVPSLINPSEGFLYCYDDVHYLAGVIIRAFSMGKDISAISQKGFERASSNNNRGNNEKIMDIYRKLME